MTAASVFTVNGLELHLDPATLGLCRLLGRGGEWLSHAAPGASLWQLHLADAAGQRVDLEGRHAQAVTAAMAGETLVLSWHGVRQAEAVSGDLTVEVRIAPAPHPAGPGLTHWHFKVTNQSPSYTIWHQVFPRLVGLQPSATPARDQLFWPELWGMQSTGWELFAEVAGPCGGYGKHAMQFIGLSRPGTTLYLGAHDPGGWQKQMIFKPASPPSRKVKTAPLAQLSFLSHPSGMTQAGNSYEQPYPMVLGELAGDYYDAARLYASFARLQSWACQPPKGADPRPREQREVLVWEQASINSFPSDRVTTVNGLAPADWVAQMKALRERLGVRLAVHLYHWHQTPFDTNYPDYFPVKAGLQELVAELRQAGVVTMPYINGRLWDLAAPSYGRTAARHAEKISGQRVNPRQLYAWPECYGNGQQLTGMCLDSDYWHKVVVKLCQRITQELGCGGVYLDQLGCFGGRVCLDPRHGHPLGGGGYWLAGYRRLMQKVRRAVGPEVLLTTENNWEGCVADFDALLDTHWNQPGNLPIFPAVYWGQGAIYGGDVFAAAYREGGEAFIQRMGMRFVWGGLFGWGHFEPLLKPENADLLAYFSQLCRLRTEYGRVFQRGEFLRPPELVALPAETPIREPLAGPVLSALWADPDGPGSYLALVNVTRAAITVRVHCQVPSAFAMFPLTVTLAPMEAQVRARVGGVG